LHASIDTLVVRLNTEVSHRSENRYTLSAQQLDRKIDDSISSRQHVNRLPKLSLPRELGIPSDPDVSQTTCWSSHAPNKHHPHSPTYIQYLTYNQLNNKTSWPPASPPRSAAPPSPVPPPPSPTTAPPSDVRSRPRNGCRTLSSLRPFASPWELSGERESSHFTYAYARDEHSGKSKQATRRGGNGSRERCTRRTPVGIIGHAACFAA